MKCTDNNRKKKSYSRRRRQRQRTLRLMTGISRQQFEKTFQVTLDSVYGEVLRKLKSEQLIEEVAGYVRLTEYGIDVSNYVLSEFLLKFAGNV